MKFIDCSFGNLKIHFGKISKPYLIVSSSNSPYFNLALESHLFEIPGVIQNNCVFMWRNRPSVVIGRFQNPWEEISVEYVKTSNIDVCRRYSGGGCVYHDLGNINFTFFSTFNKLSRMEDMRKLAEFLNDYYMLDIMVTDRHDLWSNGFKVSGSSARIVKDKAYHHCTLLCFADITSMSNALKPTVCATKSLATKSIRSNVMNLFSSFHQQDYLTMVESFISYLKGHGDYALDDIINVLDASDDGVFQEEIDKLSSWSWIYGQTPEFSISLIFCEPPCILSVKIVNGIVVSVSPLDEEYPDIKEFCKNINDSLKNKKFDVESLRNYFWGIRCSISLHSVNK